MFNQSRNVLTGKLYIVATPIGNLDDLSRRAITVLSEVALIAAEDTRHSAHLLDHYGIGTRRISLHEHNEAARTRMLLDRLNDGESIALISDAGTPLISDPGYRLASAARAAGIEVSPVPGSCALVAAISVSGIDTERFCFEGFLPSSRSRRRERLRELATESRTLVFYESPHRVVKCLTDLGEVFGSERLATVCRELTKRFETVHHDSLGALLEWIQQDPNQQKGEFVLVIEGASAEHKDCDPAWVAAVKELCAYMPPKEAARIISAATGASRQQLYRLATRAGK